MNIKLDPLFACGQHIFTTTCLANTGLKTNVNTIIYYVDRWY